MDPFHRNFAESFSTWMDVWERRLTALRSSLEQSSVALEQLCLPLRTLDVRLSTIERRLVELEARPTTSPETETLVKENSELVRRYLADLETMRQSYERLYGQYRELRRELSTEARP